MASPRSTHTTSGCVLIWSHSCTCSSHTHALQLRGVATRRPFSAEVLSGAQVRYEAQKEQHRAAGSSRKRGRRDWGAAAALELRKDGSISLDVVNKLFAVR